VAAGGERVLLGDVAESQQQALSAAMRRRAARQGFHRTSCASVANLTSLTPGLTCTATGAFARERGKNDIQLDSPFGAA